MHHQRVKLARPERRSWSQRLCRVQGGLTRYVLSVLKIVIHVAWRPIGGESKASNQIYLVPGLTSALAAELSPFRIRTNAIVPGYIETDMIASQSPPTIPSSPRLPFAKLQLYNRHVERGSREANSHGPSRHSG